MFSHMTPRESQSSDDDLKALNRWPPNSSLSTFPKTLPWAESLWQQRPSADSTSSLSCSRGVSPHPVLPTQLPGSLPHPFKDCLLHEASVHPTEDHKLQPPSSQCPHSPRDPLSSCSPAPDRNAAVASVPARPCPCWHVPYEREGVAPLGNIPSSVSQSSLVISSI